MTIVHITQGTTGGLYTYITDLMLSLRDRGCSQILFCPDEGPLIGKIKRKGFDVEVIHAVREISPLSDLKAGAEISKAIKHYAPDVIHLHSSKAGALGRLTFPGIPVVYTPHGWSFNMAVSHLKQSIYALTERVLTPSTDRIVAISKYEYDSAIANNICGPEKIILIENAINLESFKPVNSDLRLELRKRYGVADDEILIGSVGRLTESKDPKMFVEIADAFKGNKKLKFMWVGDGELSDEIHAYAKEKGVDDRIIFVGWTEQVGAHMQAMDIGLHTASWEGFGLVIAEFMATGIPVVSSNVGGILEIIDDGYTGFLCGHDDLDSYVSSIKRLISDDELRRGIVRHALRTVKERYALDRLVDQHVELYESIRKPKAKNE